MDKIITINLGGFSIKIDEDAFEVLKKYINAIERKYSQTENGKEIINDIEARIAELLLENLNGKVSSSLADVEQVLKSMGNPDEFDENEESDQGKKRNNFDENIPKRLYRDGDDKMLGGVCSGISKYLDIDPTIVRILWLCLVLFFGTGFLVYIILWVIVPEAVTTAQKLEMTGKAPTMDNIINKVKTEAQNVEKNIRAQNFSQKIKDIFKSIAPLFMMVFKIFSVFLGVIFLVILAGFIIALVSGTFSYVVSNGGFHARQIPNIFDDQWEMVSLKVLIGLFIGIPLFHLITGLFKFATNSNVNYRPVRRVLNIVWVFTIPLIMYFGYNSIRNFKNLETKTTVNTETVKPNLVIKSEIEDEEFAENTSFKIENSTDSFLHVIINETASGDSKKEALNNASKIGAEYKFDGSTLVLKKSDFYEKNNFFRRQRVEFLIQIPDKINFTIDPGLQRQSVYVKGTNIVHFTGKNNVSKNDLVFLGGNLYCPACPDSLPVSYKNESNLENFNKVEISGWMDIEIIKGKVYNIQKTGKDHIVDNIEIEQNGKVLSISLNDKYLNIGSKPKIIITTPDLEELELSGANICSIEKFSGKSIDVRLSGASSANLNLDYDKANIELSGVSKLNIGGKINKIQYSVTGASGINSKNLVSQNVEINITGASQIAIGKTDSIEGTASGACKIEYTGKPFYDVKTSGLCKVEHY